MLTLASNDQYGTCIYIQETDGFPEFVVEVDETPTKWFQAYSAEDCEETARELYDKYLTANAVSAFLDDVVVVDDKDDDDLDKKDDIEQRDGELWDGMWAFLSDVLAGDYSPAIIDRITDDVLEHTLEYIHRKHGLDIFRPMFLEDEKGERFFEEYPYSHIVYDDPDNPIYKT